MPPQTREFGSVYLGLQKLSTNGDFLSVAREYYIILQKERKILQKDLFSR